MAKADHADAINDLDEFLENASENGIHLCNVLFINPRTGKDGRNWTVFKFQVTDPESPLEGEEYERWIQDWSHLTVDEFKSLSAREKSRVRRDKKSLKDAYLGCGFSEDEYAELRKNPDNSLRENAKGRQVRIEVFVSENNDREYKNVRRILPAGPDTIGDLNDVPF